MTLTVHHTLQFYPALQTPNRKSDIAAAQVVEKGGEVFVWTKSPNQTGRQGNRISDENTKSFFDAASSRAGFRGFMDEWNKHNPGAQYKPTGEERMQPPGPMILQQQAAKSFPKGNGNASAEKKNTTLEDVACQWSGLCTSVWEIVAGLVMAVPNRISESCQGKNTYMYHSKECVCLAIALFLSVFVAICLSETDDGKTLTNAYALVLVVLWIITKRFKPRTRVLATLFLPCASIAASLVVQLAIMFGASPEHAGVASVALAVLNFLVAGLLVWNIKSRGYLSCEMCLLVVILGHIFVYYNGVHFHRFSSTFNVPEDTDVEVFFHQSQENQTETVLKWEKEECEKRKKGFNATRTKWVECIFLNEKKREHPQLNDHGHSLSITNKTGFGIYAKGMGLPGVHSEGFEADIDGYSQFLYENNYTIVNSTVFIPTAESVEKKTACTYNTTRSHVLKYCKNANNPGICTEQLCQKEDKVGRTIVLLPGGLRDANDKQQPITATACWNAALTRRLGFDNDAAEQRNKALWNRSVWVLALISIGVILFCKDAGLNLKVVYSDGIRNVAIGSAVLSALIPMCLWKMGPTITGITAILFMWAFQTLAALMVCMAKTNTRAEKYNQLFQPFLVDLSTVLKGNPENLVQMLFTNEPGGWFDSLSDFRKQHTNAGHLIDPLLKSREPIEKIVKNQDPDEIEHLQTWLKDATESAGKNEPFPVLTEPLATQANETCKHITHATHKLASCVVWIITRVIALVFWIIELLVTFPSKVLVWVAKIWTAFARKCEFPPGSGNLICAWTGIMQLGWHRVAIYQILKDSPSPKDVFMSVLLVFQIDVLQMINDADNDETYKAGFQDCKTAVKTFFKENLFENDQAINRCWSLFACMHETPLGWKTRCMTWFGMYFVAMLGIHLVYKVCKSFLEPKEAADNKQPASQEQPALTQ